MPNISQIRDSKFLTKEDCGPNGALVTITDCFQENVGMQGQALELKWCLSFQEMGKPMVLNSTNAQLIANILHSEETEHWIGQRIVIYNDPTIQYAGKLVGGIRVRAPRGQAAAQRQQPVQQPYQPQPQRQQAQPGYTPAAPPPAYPHPAPVPRRPTPPPASGIVRQQPPPPPMQQQPFPQEEMPPDPGYQGGYDPNQLPPEEDDVPF